MIIVDRDRCCYCGGCVSVCPVDALTLAETRLLVTGECTECGQCVSACPVGALRLEERKGVGRRAPVRRRYDLVVVGAGPGGSMAAKTAAEAGLSVLLLEKRQEIGSPVRCAEGVGRDQLIAFIEPDPRCIAAEVNKAEITTIAGGEKETLRARRKPCVLLTATDTSLNGEFSTACSPSGRPRQELRCELKHNLGTATTLTRT